MLMKLHELHFINVTNTLASCPVSFTETRLLYSMRESLNSIEDLNAVLVSTYMYEVISRKVVCVQFQRWGWRWSTGRPRGMYVRKRETLTRNIARDVRVCDDLKHVRTSVRPFLRSNRYFRQGREKKKKRFTRSSVFDFGFGRKRCTPPYNTFGLPHEGTCTVLSNARSCDTLYGCSCYTSFTRTWIIDERETTFSLGHKSARIGRPPTYVRS